MTGIGWTAVIVLWIVPFLVCVSIGSSKHREGWLYGLLGWLGVIVLALLPGLRDPDLEVCPWCREDVKHGAVICPHCRRELTPEQRPPTPEPVPRAFLARVGRKVDGDRWADR